MNVIHTDVPLVRRAHELVSGVLREGDAAIDATVGNGHDTCFLAESVGPSGTVYGFDIQQSAIEQTRERLHDLGLIGRVKLYLSDHRHLGREITLHETKPIRAVMFNLGYLPGSDKRTITRSESTIAALADALKLMDNGGIATVLCYLGHPGGQAEYEAVEQWSEQLPVDEHQVTWEVPRTKTGVPPRILCVRKHLKK